jgi:transcription antitermination factor NusG
MDKKWYVAKTRAKQELSLEKKIFELDLGIETYLPKRIEVRNWRDRKKKVETVLIPNTIFIKGTKEEVISLHNEHGLKLSFVRDITGATKNGLLVVPDGQMTEFIRFLELAGTQYEVEDDLRYVKGDKVIVTQGAFKGITGVLVRLDGGDKVVVSLEGMIACSVHVTLDSVEKINGLL